MKHRATVLVVRDNRTLLVARERSRWALPGRRIRRDEAPHEAASRELEEETTIVAERPIVTPSIAIVAGIFGLLVACTSTA